MEVKPDQTPALHGLPTPEMWIPGRETVRAMRQSVSQWIQTPSYDLVLAEVTDLGQRFREFMKTQGDQLPSHHIGTFDRGGNSARCVHVSQDDQTKGFVFTDDCEVANSIYYNPPAYPNRYRDSTVTRFAAQVLPDGTIPSITSSRGTAKHTPMDCGPLTIHNVSSADHTIIDFERDAVFLSRRNMRRTRSGIRRGIRRLSQGLDLLIQDTFG